jgi:hypothetical protein
MKNTIKVLLVVLVVLLIARFYGNNLDENSTKNESSSENVSLNEDVKLDETQKQEKLLYSDDNFKITFVDFKDPKAGVTSYNLYLRIENNSDKTVIVAPSDGYANNEAVFLGSGMPVKIAPNKMATGAFVVGYGNTSIQSIDEIKTLELKIKLYDENWSEKVLETENLTITLE